MDELSAQTNVLKEPLASRMRPPTLDEYIAQHHIVGRGRTIRTDSIIYAGIRVKGTGSNSALFTHEGLWSYYPSRGKWNIE